MRFEILINSRRKKKPKTQICLKKVPVKEQGVRVGRSAFLTDLRTTWGRFLGPVLTHESQEVKVHFGQQWLKSIFLSKPFPASSDGLS